MSDWRVGLGERSERRLGSVTERGLKPELWRLIYAYVN
jgi:hypothetical protein